MYFVGLTVTDPVNGTYELHPHLKYFDSLDCTLPVGEKNIRILWDGKVTTVNLPNKIYFTYDKNSDKIMRTGGLAPG